MKIQQELINYLLPFITPKRAKLFDKILQDRTRYITVLLEDIYQSQNASAVLRSCDCFGIQDVNIIENRNEFTVNPEVSLGSSKWLNLRRYSEYENNTLKAIHDLKSKGYRIVATTPHSNDIELQNFDLSKGKVALAFGTELTGISDTIKNEADEFLKIPMYGFTESFNISVSVAIILHHLSLQLRNSNINWKINEDQKNEILLYWLKNSIKKSETIINDYQTKP